MKSVSVDILTYIARMLPKSLSIWDKCVSNNYEQLKLNASANLHGII